MRLKSILSRFTRSQQIGVVFLLTLIFVLQYFLFFVDFSQNHTFDISSPEIQSLDQEIDSLKRVEIERRKSKIYPFNPSFLTDYKADKFGMNIVEIDRLFAHRKRGKYINSSRQFQKVTGISDSLLAVMSPHFKFPEWVTKKNNRTNYSNSNSATLAHDYKSTYVKKIDNFSGPKKDLNTATITDLRQVRGIGEKLATRIVKYRAKLKGFMIDDQIYEVWYLDKEVADRVLSQFTVTNKPIAKRININTAQFKEVLHAPYMNYELTKKIFELRDEMAEIQSMEELKKIDSFPIDKFDRISLYLTVE